MSGKMKRPHLSEHSESDASPFQTKKEADEFQLATRFASDAVRRG